MKAQIIAVLAICLFITSALFIAPINSAIVATATIQASGIITKNSEINTLTIILRHIFATSINPNNINITQWVDTFVEDHSYANAITIGDFHQYGIWWYGYTFNETAGTWNGWTFRQLQTFIDRFHYHNWKVGLESTAIAWNNQEEYQYITKLHPELAFTDANGLLSTGIDSTNAKTKNPGYNKVIPNFFAKYTTDDTVNNITQGTRLIDLYTTRLTQMIKDGITWDFWFGTDGWNGFNLQGYKWNSVTPSGCYSFSVDEENQFGNWSKAILPPQWNYLNQTQKASAILSNPITLNNWWYYWQIQFAQMYAQIKQAFINAGQSPTTFHVIGSADESSEPGSGGNLAATGMYNMSLLAEFNAVDYIYVNQEFTMYTGATYSLAREQAFAAAIVKMQNPNLHTIIGLQLVDWLGNKFPLWEVKQEFLAQLVNYVWFNGQRYQASDPKVIMLQYPTQTGWKDWTDQEITELFTFIKTMVLLYQNADPVYLGPTYATPNCHSGSAGVAWWGLNYSIAQWAPTANLANNANAFNTQMGTLLIESSLADGGPNLNATSKTVISLWGNNQLNLWYWEDVPWTIEKGVFNDITGTMFENNFHITKSWGQTSNYTVTNNIFGNKGATYILPESKDNWYRGVYTAQPGFSTIASFTHDNPQNIAIGYYKNDTTGTFLLTHFPSGKQNQQISLDRSTINQILYWISKSPVNSSDTLIDLKVLKLEDNSIIIPMINQKDVSNERGNSTGWSIDSILSIDQKSLGLADPSQYKIYWAFSTSEISVLDWSKVQITLNGMADSLIIAPR